MNTWFVNMSTSLLTSLNELFWFKYKLFERWFEMIINEWYLWIKRVFKFEYLNLNSNNDFENEFLKRYDILIYWMV